MDAVHWTIGVASILALVVVLTESASQVGGRLRERTAEPFCAMVTFGSPVSDQLGAAEGTTTLVEGDGMDNVCCIVRTVGGSAFTFLGSLIPGIGCDREAPSGETEGEGENKSEPEPEPETKPAETEQPAEEE
ncbi:hypothetical protein KR009_007592 [Drosophila setifemur]|nr:hypothetical protein KR009_007592 [Drosophila setifemur]